MGYVLGLGGDFCGWFCCYDCDFFFGMLIMCDCICDNGFSLFFLVIFVLVLIG